MEVIEQIFNGVKVTIDLEKKWVVINDTIVYILAKYLDDMDVEKFTVTFMIAEQYQAGAVDPITGLPIPPGTLIPNSKKHLTTTGYQDDKNDPTKQYYTYFTQDWITQNFRKMGMANNLGELELSTYLGEKVHFFLDQFRVDGQTKNWIAVTPPYAYYDKVSGKFFAENIVEGDEYKVFGTLPDNTTFEDLMTLVDGKFEVERELPSGQTKFYVQNITVGNRNFNKYVDIVAPEVEE